MLSPTYLEASLNSAISLLESVERWISNLNFRFGDIQEFCMRIRRDLNILAFRGDLSMQLYQNLWADNLIAYLRKNTLEYFRVIINEDK